MELPQKLFDGLLLVHSCGRQTGICTECGHHNSSMMQDAASPGWGTRAPECVRRWLTMLETLLRFCARQAYGWPQGAHAAFQAVGVDALTLRLVLEENEVSYFASQLLLCSPLFMCMPYP